MNQARAKYHLELVGGRYIEFEGEDKDLSTINTSSPFIINGNNQVLVPWTSILSIEKVVKK